MDKLKEFLKNFLSQYKKELNKNYPNFETYKTKYTIRNLFEDLPKIQAGETNNNYISNSTKCLTDLNIRQSDWQTLTYNESRKLNNNDKQIYKICIENENIK